MALLRNTEGITIEGTYTAKPIAAIMDDAAHGKLEGSTVLFWNTYCGINFSSLMQMSDYTTLPQEFHRYFHEPVQ